MNGFQMRPVPKMPSIFAILALGALLLLGRARQLARAVFAGAVCFICLSEVSAQSFNIDIGLPAGAPELGGGPPSDSFGAAAGQAGRWNNIGFGAGPHNLLDISGVASSVILQVQAGPGGFVGGGGFHFAGNTGDYARLLNDAAWVGTLVAGGSLTYTFSGLLPGYYEVYTYAANIGGNVTATPVEIPLATHNRTQIVTGPMPGNSFGFLVTHSVHQVSVTHGASVDVSIVQPAGLPDGFSVNGFQIVAVPEPPSGIYAASLLFALLLRNRATRP